MYIYQYVIFKDQNTRMRVCMPLLSEQTDLLIAIHAFSKEYKISVDSNIDEMIKAILQKAFYLRIVYELLFSILRYQDYVFLCIISKHCLYKFML